MIISKILCTLLYTDIFQQHEISHLHQKNFEEAMFKHLKEDGNPVPFYSVLVFLNQGSNESILHERS